MRKLFKSRFSLFVLVLALAMVVAACGGGSSTPQPPSTGGGDADADGPQPVVIRIMADFPPPPFNAAVAIEEFGEKLAEAIPGSELRSYFAGALYPTESEALEAMVAGNLEMIFGQYGKGAGFEPALSVVNAPGNWTTIGAMRHFPESETAKILADRMYERGIEILANAHLSFFLSIADTKGHVTHPSQLAGRSVRSMDPIVGNAVLSAWGANPITMAFGEVPSALETGALDAIGTSVGGWTTVREQTPYFSVLGVGGLTTDLYYIGVSRVWWDQLNEATQNVIRELVAELAQRSDEITYCDDVKAQVNFGTDDPSQPGLYILKEEEKQAFRDAMGTAGIDALKRELPAEFHDLVDLAAQEGREFSERYPEGSDSLEQTDCEAIWEQYNR